MWIPAVVGLLSLPPQEQQHEGPWLEVSPRTPCRDDAVDVHARLADGTVAAGAVLELRDSVDAIVRRATTGADGRAEFQAPALGGYTLHWQAAPHLHVVVPLVVVEDGSKTSLALWTVPLGLFLGWSTLRRRAPGGGRQAVPGATAAQPSTFSTR